MKKKAAKLSARLQGLTLPHSIQAEQSVLGSALYGSEQLAAAVSDLTVEDFYDPKHRLIYDSILSLTERNEVCDILTVTDYLESNSQIGQAGGYEYIASLPDKTPILANYPQYIEVVLNHSEKRQLIFALDEIISLCYSSNEDASTLIQLAAQKIYQIRESSDNIGFERIGVVLRERIRELEERASGKALQQLMTHYPSIDSIVGGLRKGGLYILASRPGVGKSSLSLNIGHNVASFENATVAIFSLEMSKAEVATRILISRSLMPLQKLETLRMKDEASWQQIGKALGDLYNKKIFIDDRSAITAMEIHARCRQLQLQHSLDLVIVDYLQLMGSASRRSLAENRQQQIAEISRTLKVMARELDVPVIALSQLNREIDKSGRQPRLADLRESGSIEQDADVVMFLHKPADGDEDFSEEVMDVEFIVEKNRQGQTRKTILEFKPELMTFYESEDTLPEVPF
ncbi:MAG: replicative DNA helicase [Fastidiosipila sp.]|nr:replicative DNA helicase [Fastidiosipila sp.]